MTDDTQTDDQQIRRDCDRVVTLAAQTMIELGANLPMALDRILTFAAAHAVQIEGSKGAAAAFRSIADTIEGGIFEHIEERIRGKRH